MRSVEWVEGKLRFIDQTRLPHEEHIVDTDDLQVVAEAIRSLRIRGAPAIGVAAAFGVVLALKGAHGLSLEQASRTVDEAIAFLSATRPTAVNLFSTLRRMAGVRDWSRSPDVHGLGADLLHEALAIQREDIDACARIATLGSELIRPGSSILTHCNAGALATAGEGTALGVIAAAARKGKIVRVFADETRPLFQGSRLTAWELVRLGIPTTIITDSSAATVLQKGMVQAVIVGADRIAANGDTANKVGTYPLAVLGARHSIPFYVAAPTSTLDPQTPDGSAIPIEERNPREVTDVGGKRIAADGVNVFAPAFDVTPSELITAIVTERGILRPPYRDSIAQCLRSTGDAHADGL
jgi:methylthioribose-1-phosphate isomerase